EHFDAEEAEKMQKKMAKGSFGFDDFLKQMQAMKKMGGMSSMLKLLPGVGQQMGDMDIDDSEAGKMEGIVHSMTTQERRNPDIIDSSRRRRIARGCGRELQDVAGLIKTFKRSRDMMKTMSAGGMGGLKNMLSGKTDMFSAMNSGRKVKQRSKRKRVIKRRGKIRRR
ncbi:MAG: signal recognition particle protein, partial [Planctomycetes bacterium]|nr:signal recognition particle protein [Planctomycetota bacterium]